MSRLAYAAHTKSAIFYLDENGICQEVAPADPSEADVPNELARCIGAQYVASLDLSDASGLVSLPKPGASMLFVVADGHMRFSLVRTALLDRFDHIAELGEEDVLALEEREGDTLVPAKAEPAAEPAERAAAAASDTSVDIAIDLGPVPDITVTWPSGDVLARALPLPATFKLTAPPQPVRRAFM